MQHPDDGRNHGPSNGDNPHAPGAGPQRPTRRRRWAWLLLAAGLALLGVGVAAGDGLLLAAGLIIATVAVQMFSGARGPR